MDQNRETVRRFYEAFQVRDANAMAACYHADVHFSDEVFTDLRGSQAGAMWAMLCNRAEDLRVDFRDVTADDHSGRAHWEAWYTFTSTGRQVHNVIDAEFEFQDGKIIRHRDSFDFWRWARQALGPVGLLLGWSPLLRGRVRRDAARNLDRFMRRASAVTP